MSHLPLRYISHEYRDIGAFSQQNRSYITTPPSPSFNQSHVYGGGLGPSSPMGSSIPLLFTSPSKA